MRKLGSKRICCFVFVGLCFALAGMHTTARAENTLFMPMDINPGPDPLNPNSDSSFTDLITDVNGLVFFIASVRDPDPNCFFCFLNRVWVTVGTEDGTIPLNGNAFLSITPTNPSELVAGNQVLYFVADGVDLESDPVQLFGRELWLSGGTDFSTMMVADIVPGSGGSFPTNLAVVGDRVFFAANGADGAGNELWVSDGVPLVGNTTRVRDINPGTAGSMGKIAAPIAVGDTLFFWANDGTNGTELWKSDGTLAGTVMVLDINPAPGSSSSSFDPNPGVIIGSRKHRAFDPIAVGDTLFFSADDGIHGVELWRSDGTPGGTIRLTDINSRPPAQGVADSDPFWLTEMNGEVFFTADDKAATGRELWKVDVATNAVSQVRDIRIGSFSSRDEFNHDMLVAMNGLLYFAANDGTNGTALWRTDGSFDETTMVVDLNIKTDGSAPLNKLTRVGNSLFFVADDGATGVELWESDGTSTNTHGFDINPFGDSIALITGPRGIDLVESAGRLFVPADGGLFGDELWNTVDEIPFDFDPLRFRLGGNNPPAARPGADVSAQVTSSANPVVTDHLFSYRIKAKNNGPELAVGVKLINTLATGTSFAFEASSPLFAPASCFAAFGVVTCDVGNLANGKTKEFTLVVQAPMVTGAILNNLDVTSTSLDSNVFNDSDFALTNVVAPSAGVDLSVQKSVELNPVPPGMPIVYNIVVFNEGSDTATSVVLTDPLPADVSFASVDSTPAGVCLDLAGTVTCNLGTMPGGSSALVHIVAMAPASNGTITNTVSVASAQPDTDPSDNLSSVNVFVPEPGQSQLALTALATLLVLARRRRGA